MNWATHASVRIDPVGRAAPRRRRLQVRTGVSLHRRTERAGMPVHSLGRSACHTHGRLGQDGRMNQRPVRYVVLVALLGLLAGCSASSGATATTATTSTSTSNATTTSTMAPAPSTLPASAVSIVKAPVLVAQHLRRTVGYRSRRRRPAARADHGLLGVHGQLGSRASSIRSGGAHRVVIFDNAGIGRTAPLPAPLTISGMADQTAALIEALHLGRTDVLGWSMGGMIAQALAVSASGSRASPRAVCNLAGQRKGDGSFRRRRSRPRSPVGQRHPGDVVPGGPTRRGEGLRRRDHRVPALLPADCRRRQGAARHVGTVARSAT